MSFCEALNIVLNTANSRLRRKKWHDDSYISMEIDCVNNNKLIIMNFKINNEKCKELYRPINEDLVCNDWILI